MMSDIMNHMHPGNLQDGLEFAFPSETDPKNSMVHIELTRYACGAFYGSIIFKPCKTAVTSALSNSHIKIYKDVLYKILHSKYMPKYEFWDSESASTFIWGDRYVQLVLCDKS